MDIQVFSQFVSSMHRTAESLDFVSFFGVPVKSWMLGHSNSFVQVQEVFLLLCQVVLPGVVIFCCCLFFNYTISRMCCACQPLNWSDFTILANHMGVKWWVSVILISFP